MTELRVGGEARDEICTAQRIACGKEKSRRQDEWMKKQHTPATKTTMLGVPTRPRNAGRPNQAAVPRLPGGKIEQPSRGPTTNTRVET